MRRLLALAAGLLIGLDAVLSDPVSAAQEWIKGDPDPDTRRELQSLIDTGEMDEIAARMGGSLVFGTAGLRGRVAAGSNRMNRAVVIRTTRGLADYLMDQNDGVPDQPVVVGYDARPSSRQFAEDTVGVLAANGLTVLYFPDVTPTPLVAFTAKHVDAVAAVVVTASHNPPADNGYKVYAANAAQIIPPADALIAEAISRVGPAVDVPRLESAMFSGRDGVDEVPADILDRYWVEVDACRPEPTPSGLKVVYTPLHGVGGGVVGELFRRAGHTGLCPVPEQAQPDGTFPTVSFPNPEEEGALDLAMAQAVDQGAELVIANDPDADRLAAVVADGEQWRPLTGNELGVLLGDYVLRNHRHRQRPIVVNSIVSSPMLGRLAEERDARFERTLTGFKWIANAGLALERDGEGVFVFGYEEALGYTIGSTVRDKDGMSAALIFTDLVAGLRDTGATVLDRLAELWAMTGVWASTQHSVTRAGPDGPGSIRAAVQTLAEEAPRDVGGHRVTDMTDYRENAGARPPWLGAQALVELVMGDRGRVLVRPSGTEPKLKVYVDLVAEVSDDPHGRQLALKEEADEIARAVIGLLEL